MGKIRINDLARDLEVKSKSILDALAEVGVTEKKTHSSSLEDHEAEKVRNYFRAASDAQKVTASARQNRSDGDGIKTKIDLSHISKPGDVLKAIISKQQPEAQRRRQLADQELRLKQSLLQAHQQRLGPPYQLIVQLRCHLRKCRNQNTWFRLRPCALLSAFQDQRRLRQSLLRRSVLHPLLRVFRRRCPRHQRLRLLQLLYRQFLKFRSRGHRHLLHQSGLKALLPE